MQKAPVVQVTPVLNAHVLEWFLRSIFLITLLSLKLGSTETQGFGEIAVAGVRPRSEQVYTNTQKGIKL